MFIGGLDIGTTGCKLSVYSDKGEFVFNSYKEYEINRVNGMHEIDAQTIFDSVCDVICETVKKYDLEAVGVTTFGETFVALDEDDNVLLPSMLYTDPRGNDECKTLCEKLGEKRLIEISGVKPHPMYSLPKIMWIKNNLSEVYSKIKRILLMEDYIIYKLCGNACIDYSLAARTMAFDIRNKCWSREIFDAAGIDPSLMSDIVQAGNVAGTLKNELAEALGAKKSFKIVNGSHDQVASTVGAGIFRSGEAVDGTGTVECIVPIFDKIPENSELYDKGYAVVPYVVENTYVCYAFSFTGGAVLKWFRDNFAAKYKESENIYAQLDANVKDAPTGILVLPHFAGAATPYMDNLSRAAIVGLTLEHNESDIYKALMEGVTYEIMINIEHLEHFGIKPDKIYATGGGASSDVWLQIKADILNRPVTSLAAKEVGACGTCMLAGVGIGIYKDLEEAKKYFVKQKNTAYPDDSKNEIYAKYYSAYRKLYNAVRPIVEEANN
ncbi:MAG: carbohydrate kinase [Ruminococcaceae bacterium]|nr:carbohydrate kinase [Oscillospiraceae bacterium]